MKNLELKAFLALLLLNSLNPMKQILSFPFTEYETDVQRN
jgi:hypothetical protein